MTFVSPNPGFPPESNVITNGEYYNNLLSIAEFLENNGYSRAAAAGMAGTIAGESSGNPESVGSGGAGLIGWTPPSSAKPNNNIVTGNTTSDWDTQLVDLLTYANTEGPTAELQSQTDPIAAAHLWSQAFERPLNLYSDVLPNVVDNIYAELANYSPAGGGYTGGTGSTATNAGTTVVGGSSGGASGGTTGTSSSYQAAATAAGKVFQYIDGFLNPTITIVPGWADIFGTNSLVSQVAGVVDRAIGVLVGVGLVYIGITTITRNRGGSGGVIDSLGDLYNASEARKLARELESGRQARSATSVDASAQRNAEAVVVRRQREVAQQRQYEQRAQAHELQAERNRTAQQRADTAAAREARLGK